MPWEGDNANILWRMRYYGFTDEAELEEFVNRPCEICGITNTRTCIDHDHATGYVRGNLCYRCNTRVGMIERNKHISDKAWFYKGRAYVEKYNKAEAKWSHEGRWISHE